ncbi:hypothetical protein JTE90_012873 [Oedothorax gibbosus]|uniref:Uncharacterized protein n=1 Tax=Oedothorax gibbosus TaxID=931172 RepID=A0AAV6UN28_9ARAC|nr:hypothetical protein JTE90_012873 [Oedothorax gibbosus]
MKSSASNRAACVPSSTSPLSQIPLPKRKNSAKGDKGVDVDLDTDGSEYGCVASNAPRIQAKMSLLGSTSFCCASGQKEDYVPDAKIVPAVRPPKKRPPNVNAKKDQELSTPKSPLLAAGRSFLSRSKKGKVSQENSEEIPFLPTETTSVKLMPDDTKPRPIENKLRPPDDRKKTMITPPSPQRRLQREPAIPRKDHNVESVKKYSDAIRKYRSESSNQIPMDSIKKCKHATNDGKFEPGKSDQKIECSGVLNKDLTFDCGDALNKSHDSEDFDCPCCDRTSVMLDEAGLSDIDVKMFTSCDVIAPDPPLVKDDEDIKDTSTNGVSNF